jgi:hypothetical protein
MENVMSDLEKEIGLLIGREWSWPSAFITEVNRRDVGVNADFVKIGQTEIDSNCDYDLIIDRMSHEIPYYKTYLKFAAINGCYVINDPFMLAADDKFFGVSLGHQLGIRTPRTVALPNKRVEAENVPESFRNLVYPMDWQGIINYVGVPAILKDVLTGGRRVAERVNNVDELIRWFDESDTLTVVLQEIVETDYHIHCYVVGKGKVLTIQYSHDEGRYLPDFPVLTSQQEKSVRESSLAVSKAYGYDLNMVEFVIHEGEPYLINPTNPTPELDIKLLGAKHFGWCVTEIANFAIDTVLNPSAQFLAYSWQRAIGSLHHLSGDDD